MSATATALPYQHEFILPYAGPLLLPEPWRLLNSNADQSVHLLQNVTSAPVTIPTGVPSWPTVDVPAGDTLVAVIYTSNPAVMLIGRIPYAGRRFTTAKTARLDLPYLSSTMYDEGDTFIALAGLRGSCGGVASGSVTATWTPAPAVPGFPGVASANGVATQPTGDAAGNISAGQAAILNTGGVFALSAFAASSGPCGLSLQNRRPTTHLILASEPLLFEVTPALDAPVTLHMSESLTGVFADPSIDATFFSLVDLPIGARHSLGDQISGQPWYNFTIRDKSVQGGLVSYSGETLLARLDRIRPTESLILVAGQNGVPDPLTLREVLVRFLDYYGVPYDPDVPEFYLRVGDEILVPTVPAFAIQPDQENPESVYALLEPWWGVFRQYTFRADDQDRLKVTPPAWVDTIGARLNLWRRRQDNDRTPTNSTARVPWTTARRPIVEWVATVDGVPFSGALPAPLEHGAPIGEFSVGPITIRIQWRTSDNTVQASVWPPPPIDRTIGSLYQITLVLRPESLPGDEVLELTLADLDPADVVSASADTVINQVVIPHRERTFLPNQQLMQAGALVLRSPVQTAAGLFGNNFPYGPMAEELETPTDFLEIANEISQAGTWFWPVDEGVVIQPGGNVTVAYEVEEWAEMWGHNNVFSPQPAEEVNTHSGTVELPANGAEVQLFQFQFPRRTWATSIGGYQAQGRVYGRWRAGENPGIEVRVGNSRFVEFGYLPEFLGIFGQSVYFLWGAIIKLNGTGTTFTSGDLHTYRFGFSRGEDGTWEGGANVPGLSESQALYPNRQYTAPELPYSITPEVGLALARGIVEENLTPKVVRTLTLVPARADGYAAGPWHMGRAVRVPALGVEGRLTSIDWAEAHTAQAQGDTSQLTIDIESTAAPEGSRAAATTYRRAAYGLSHYQQEE